MRVLICGSRTFADRDPIERVISSYAKEDPDTVIINGGAKGADLLARVVAVRIGLTRSLFDADWESYGKAAGPIRNKRMLDEGQPDVVWAFVDKALESSRGTLNMVRIARDAGVPTYVVEAL